MPSHPSLQNIAVSNAGLVLLNNYLPVAFERLGLVKNKEFVNEHARQKAIACLQYLAFGSLNANEDLGLDALLCGIKPGVYQRYGMEVTNEQQIVLDDLIKAVISHWPAIGQSSIDGFRGNWLQRPGRLTESEDKWELIVEKRAYDILLNRSPFSFSIIKYPWMDKPLHVNWA